MDVVTTISLKDSSFKEHFSRLDPRRLCVSRNTGAFNNRLGLGKDYLMGMRIFLEN